MLNMCDMERFVRRWCIVEGLVSGAGANFFWDTWETGSIR